MDTPKCAKCGVKACYSGKTEELPENCPMILKGDLVKDSISLYEDVDELYRNSTVLEGEAYETIDGKLTPVRPRIREFAEFAKKMRFSNVGIAFCIGLSDEAERISEFLQGHGLEVYSVLCKCGGIDKTEFGVSDEDKIRGGFEAACNPIVQAKLLNEAGTQVNAIVGLCVGHDMIFTKYSESPVTTLIAKDRQTGHSPTAALYSTYYRDSLEK